MATTDLILINARVTTLDRGNPAADAIGPIKDYHAHVYYSDAATRETARRLREQVGALFPEARLGRWHDKLIGPHTRSMYQIAFPCESLPLLLPWLMLHREGLAILLHPNTGRPRDDHTKNALWFGEVLPVTLDALPETEDDEDDDA